MHGERRKEKKEKPQVSVNKGQLCLVSSCITTSALAPCGSTAIRTSSGFFSIRTWRSGLVSILHRGRPVRTSWLGIIITNTTSTLKRKFVRLQPNSVSSCKTSPALATCGCATIITTRFFTIRTGWPGTIITHASTILIRKLN